MTQTVDILSEFSDVFNTFQDSKQTIKKPPNSAIRTYINAAELKFQKNNTMNSFIIKGNRPYPGLQGIRTGSGWHIFYNNISGKGGFGKVYSALVFAKKEKDNIVFAPVNHIIKYQKATSYKDAFEEATLQSHQQVNIYGVIQTRDGVYTVSDNAGTSLDKFDLTKFTLDERIALALGIANELLRLKQRGIIHSDLKPHNICIEILASKRKRVKQFRVVVIDFGVAVRANNHGQASAKGGTLKYLAPEVVATEQTSDSADRYALGLILSNIFPTSSFGSDTDTQQCILKLIEALQDNNPNNRPSIDVVMKFFMMLPLRQEAYRQLQPSLEVIHQLDLTLFTSIKQGIELTAFIPKPAITSHLEYMHYMIEKGLGQQDYEAPFSSLSSEQIKRTNQFISWLKGIKNATELDPQVLQDIYNLCLAYLKEEETEASCINFFNLLPARQKLYVEFKNDLNYQMMALNVQNYIRAFYNDNLQIMHVPTRDIYSSCNNLVDRSYWAQSHLEIIKNKKLCKYPNPFIPEPIIQMEAYYRNIMDQFNNFGNLVTSNRFQGTNSTGIKQMQEILYDCSLCPFDKCLAIQKIAISRTTGWYQLKSGSFFGSLGRHKNIHKLYSDLAAVDIANGSVKVLFEMLTQVSEFMNDNEFIGDAENSRSCCL